MKKLLITCLACSLSIVGYAQDEAIFSQYFISPILINPAAAGFEDGHRLQLNARGQWSGFVDAPQTYAVNYNGALGPAFGLGVGILTETAAQLSRTRVQLNYAFRFNVKDKVKISAGFSTRYEQLSLDNAVTSGTFFDQADDIIFNALNGVGNFDASLGIFGSVNESTYMGLTINNLVKTRLDQIVTESQESLLEFFTFQFGHKVTVPDLKFTLEPSLMIRQIRDAPFQMDLNMKAGFLDDQLITGLSYRTLGTVGLLLGTRINAFYLYYSYDLSFQRFQRYTAGSHEISFAFDLKKRNKPADK